MGPGGVVRCVVAVAMVGAFMTACTTSADEKDVVSWAPEPVRSGELSVLAESDAHGFRLHTESGEKTFLPGINLGSTVPGRQPGALDVLTAKADRPWFAQRGDLGIRVERNS